MGIRDLPDKPLGKWIIFLATLLMAVQSLAPELLWKGPPLWVRLLIVFLIVGIVAYLLNWARRPTTEDVGYRRSLIEKWRRLITEVRFVNQGVPYQEDSSRRAIEIHEAYPSLQAYLDQDLPKGNVETKLTFLVRQINHLEEKWGLK
jgi:hypothetical protein